MFCMNCGQQLPDGAKFCLNCGTPQGAVAPTGITQAETINLDGMHTFVPAMCPNCSSHMKVDCASKIARCEACGTECLVQDAIKALTVKGNVQVGNATINVNGMNTDSLLRRVEMMLVDGDFSGAMSKCDNILDSDPTNGSVYLYMLMADLGCKRKIELANQSDPYGDNQYYIKAIQYGDNSLKDELSSCLKRTIERIDAENKRREVEQESIQNNPNVGDEIYFGSYNGQRIWWRVLNVHDRRALIISSRIICNKPYHQFGGKITWAECTLRDWLNNGFINDCFSSEEQVRIVPCENHNDANYQFDTPGGVPTTDKVFLLSINEVTRFFNNNEARTNGSWWWLRTPGARSNSAADVSDRGCISTNGNFVNYGNIGVRPALWLKLDI